MNCYERTHFKTAGSIFMEILYGSSSQSLHGFRRWDGNNVNSIIQVLKDYSTLSSLHQQIFTLAKHKVKHIYQYSC